jgi:hypothetical protein
MWCDQFLLFHTSPSLFLLSYSTIHSFKAFLYLLFAILSPFLHNVITSKETRWREVICEIWEGVREIRRQKNGSGGLSVVKWPSGFFCRSDDRTTKHGGKTTEIRHISSGGWHCCCRLWLQGLFPSLPPSSFLVPFIYLLMLLLFFIVSSYFTISGSILFSQVIKLLVPT